MRVPFGEVFFVFFALFFHQFNWSVELHLEVFFFWILFVWFVRVEVKKLRMRPIFLKIGVCFIRCDRLVFVLDKSLRSFGAFQGWHVARSSVKLNDFCHRISFFKFENKWKIFARGLWALFSRGVSTDGSVVRRTGLADLTRSFGELTPRRLGLRFAFRRKCGIFEVCEYLFRSHWAILRNLTLRFSI